MTSDKNINFHHALHVNENSCTACSHCMSVCPTEAIRIVGGKARINGNNCIDCGECYRVCPSRAIYVEQDDLSRMQHFKHRIALIPSVFLAQFPPSLNKEMIFGALAEIGFTEVYEIERSAEILAEERTEWITAHKEKGSCISAFCPAIVRLIQVQFPAMVDQIVLLKPPIDVAARYCFERLKIEGAQEDDIGLFYFTPCAAKIAAVKSPVGESRSLITGVINMNVIFNKVLTLLSQKSTVTAVEDKEQSLIPAGIRWCLTHGETEGVQGRALAIDGIHNVMEFLEKLERDETGKIDFLELRACDQSCAGGILVSGNRFLLAEQMQNRAKNWYDNGLVNRIHEFRPVLKKYIHLDRIYPRPSVALDYRPRVAMEKLQKVRKLMCFLPGFDCGACGAPSCHALAEDIVNGNAHISHCIFMQRIMEKYHKLSPEHSFAIIEHIWGKDRLDKNCNKKGADHDSF